MPDDKRMELFKNFSREDINTFRNLVCVQFDEMTGGQDPNREKRLLAYKSAENYAILLKDMTAVSKKISAKKENKELVSSDIDLDER